MDQSKKAAIRWQGRAKESRSGFFAGPIPPLTHKNIRCRAEVTRECIKKTRAQKFQITTDSGYTLNTAANLLNRDFDADGLHFYDYEHGLAV
ncbi:hypothetical protein [Pseudorhodobacter aquimaris]|uniref:hypothetical protein n=1 Tax=Pseudorhodobacter aquimaris TaxID=687412 RepID=UPI0012ED5815|nr:hypothetical protein [Pseudorhodobacter aquimaris]